MQAITIPRRIHIVLSDLDAVIPKYVRIALKPNEQDWDVRGVEFYATEADAHVGGHHGFLAELDFADLPGSAQLALYAALSAWQHQRRQDIHRIAVAATACVS
jgi:hypothetical protein